MQSDIINIVILDYFIKLFNSSQHIKWLDLQRSRYTDTQKNAFYN